MSQTKSLRNAAIDVIRECGPLDYKQITEEILRRDPEASSSKTPEASVAASITNDIKQHGTKSEFIRLRPGLFGLRELHAPGVTGNDLASLDQDAPNRGHAGQEINEIEQRVRTPLFPSYRIVRHLLQVWAGRPRKQVTGLEATLRELSGTPQNPVNWTDPGAWIPQRLTGEDRELANAIWTSSNNTVNPRHTYGSWLLSQKYYLVREDGDGTLRLTDKGQDFLEHEHGETESFLDEQEGLVKLLTLISDNGPTRAQNILDEWEDYLIRHSAFGKPSTFQDTLRRRLVNLLDRGFLSRERAMYSITDSGLIYLERVGTERALGGDEQQEIWSLIKGQAASVRESLHDLLSNMDAFAFELLVKRLLEEMDYQNVEVTVSSGDGGVDVVADIELGITSVREVVQAKRHKRTIQRKDLDALRVHFIDSTPSEVRSLRPLDSQEVRAKPRLRRVLHRLH